MAVWFPEQEPFRTGTGLTVNDGWSGHAGRLDHPTIREGHMSRSVSVLAAFTLMALIGHCGAGSSQAGETVVLSPDSTGAFRASVVLISGDGGWGEIESDLAAGFMVQRMSVSGIDSRVAFSAAHSVSQITHDIEATLDGRRPIILVGYSFGADLLPLLWPELTPEIRDRVVTISLIAPTHSGSTIVDPTDRYDPREHPMTPLAEHHSRLPADRLMCVYGRDERLSGYSSCPSRYLSKARLIELEGGHELGGRGIYIASEISKFARDFTHRLAHLD